MSEELAKYEPSSSAVESTGNNVTRSLEYLRGHEADISYMLKLLIYGFGALWFAFNWQFVLEFVSGIVEIQTRLIYAGVLGLVLWGMWLILSNKTFQYTVTMAVDRSIERVHRSFVARDAEGSALFAINRLRKKIRWGEESKAQVGSTLIMIKGAANDALRLATKAKNDAKGFFAEINNRKAGRKNSAIRLTDKQLEAAFVGAKGDYRREWEKYVEQAHNAEVLEARYDVITDVLESSKADVRGMDLDLKSARERLKLNLAQMSAMEASDEVANGRERQTFDYSMEILAQRADELAGRTRMILDRLDSSLQSYNAGKASAVIADDAFFQDVVNDPSITIKPETQHKLITAGSTPVIDELAEFLGDNDREVVHVDARRSTKSARSSKFDDLLN